MMSPTQRSLKKLRDDGYTVAIVERYNIYAKIRQDLWGFCDILCMSPSQGFLAVQTTSGSNLSARVLKIKQEPKAAIFLASGGKIVVHGWRKVGPRGKLKKWQCREEWIYDAGIVGDSGNDEQKRDEAFELCMKQSKAEIEKLQAIINAAIKTCKESENQIACSDDFERGCETAYGTIRRQIQSTLKSTSGKELLDELERLRKENAELRQNCIWELVQKPPPDNGSEKVYIVINGDDIDQAMYRMGQLSPQPTHWLKSAPEEITRLRAYLEKYGRHNTNCEPLGTKTCSCGLEQALNLPSSNGL